MRARALAPIAMAIAVVVAVATTAAGDAVARAPRRTPAPIEAAIVIAPPAEIAAIAARLDGHAFRTGDGVVVIDDVGGDGRPWTGVVERRGAALWLVTALGALELTGPLARPRVAGPGYTIWAVGHRDGDRLAATRIGILRRPR